MRKIFLVLLLIAGVFACGAATYTPSEVPDVHRTDRRDFVANPDGILSPAAVSQLNSELARMRSQLTVEPMIVAVDNIDDPSDASQFATELFTLWGMGKDDKDNGLLILIVKDTRRITIRTGYGLEGALPDITCGRIIREIMAPEFSQGNYDAGVLAAVSAIGRIISDPDVAEEFRSGERDTDNAANGEDVDFFPIYLSVSAIGSILILLVFAVSLYECRNKSDFDKYRRFINWKPVMLILTFAGLGIPLIVTIPLLLCLNRWRNHRRKCPNCGTVMNKVDEVHDNDYLTPAQDLEERINSVDYDVWLCPSCGETDIIPYVVSATPFVECDKCHARTARLVRDRIITQPIGNRPGKGVKEYECLNCHNRQGRFYDIPASSAANALATAAILGSMAGSGRGGSGFGGGGFSGGGFGGGSTGGGGATGGW